VKHILVLPILTLCVVFQCVTTHATELLDLPFTTLNGSGPFTTPDTSGRGNDGTLVNMTATALQSGIIGNSLSFAGGSGAAAAQRVEVAATNPDFNRTYTNFTFDAWVAPRNATQTSDAWIAGKIGLSGNRGWQIEETKSTDTTFDTTGGPGSSANTLEISFFDGPAGIGQDFYMTEMHPFTSNTWTNIAITYDSSVPAVKMYINGALIHTETSVMPTQLNGANAQPLQIGNRGANTASSWNGWIDQVHIFDTTLTQTDIQNLMQVGVPIPGDLNNDGSVNLTDYAVLTSHWLQTNVGLLNGDLNGDGVVNLLDFALFKQDYALHNGFGSGAGLSAPVPEPATALLFAAALPAWVLLRRRKATKASLCESQCAH